MTSVLKNKTLIKDPMNYFFFCAYFLLKSGQHIPENPFLSLIIQNP